MERMTILEVAAKERKHPATVRRWIQDGVEAKRGEPKIKLRATVSGSRYEISGHDLDKFKSECKKSKLQ